MYIFDENRRQCYLAAQFQQKTYHTPTEPYRPHKHERYDVLRRYFSKLRQAVSIK